MASDSKLAVLVVEVELCRARQYEHAAFALEMILLEMVPQCCLVRAVEIAAWLQTMFVLLKIVSIQGRKTQYLNRCRVPGITHCSSSANAHRAHPGCESDDHMSSNNYVSWTSEDASLAHRGFETPAGTSDIQTHDRRNSCSQSGS